jgi:FixJ family two-component response regulator
MTRFEPVTQHTREDLVVAVVDDDHSVRKALMRLARSAGYRVEGYCSGSELLESLERSRPACIVLDLHMSGINGFEVQATLKARGWLVPTIVVTAGYDTVTSARALALGALACLAKPVDGPLLLEAIKTALNGDGAATR